MKAESVVKKIISPLTRIVKKVDEQFSFKFNVLPQFIRVTEKFDIVQHYRIRDGF